MGWIQHRRSYIVLLGAVLFGNCTASTPAGVDLNPIVSLKLNPGPDFLERVQRELGSRAGGQWKGGVGYVAFQPPNPDPFRLGPLPLVLRYINLFREDTAAGAQKIYSQHRIQFTENEWKLYSEQGKPPEQSFISYKGVRFEYNHGIPMSINTKPEIFIGILKQNIFISISYSAYRRGADYIRTINDDVQYVAGLLAKVGS